LSQASEIFLDRLDRLGLPGSIRIRAHPYFEERGLHIELDAADARSFRDLAAALQRAAVSAETDDLFLVK
jgi:hypothetical protein